eukprot:CAMPEP_0170512316 /NCGR_PEP_ID=MMETSP0208-20121228/66784_1 /TAXON_ID=197538 /ORGANISM="Strombidium inclinatum, Strain S3" /LENGTH=124 /DNA_ID=CAMNT_0010795935 /DNA_START=674 /DNA_END=1048 /DNA_ORIENTATION=-
MVDHSSLGLEMQVESVQQDLDGVGQVGKQQGKGCVVFEGDLTDADGHLAQELHVRDFLVGVQLVGFVIRPIEIIRDGVVLQLHCLVDRLRNASQEGSNSRVGDQDADNIVSFDPHQEVEGGEVV